MFHSKEFLPYIDFWVECQKQGFVSDHNKIDVVDGSKLIYLYDPPLLYVDRWYGGDLGGGQTILYKAESFDVTDSSENPLVIQGTPLARLSYSGQVMNRFSAEEMQRISSVKSLNGLSQSKIIWKVLKAALSQVTVNRPLRGPEKFSFPDFPSLVYTSEEKPVSYARAIGEEDIWLQAENFWQSSHIFEGSYDWILIKKNLEDSLPHI